MSDTNPPRTFTLASRASQLARVQTNMVLAALTAAFPQHAFATSFLSSGGDRDKVNALYLLGGKALWTAELDAALASRAADILVHAFKDVPTTLAPGATIGGTLPTTRPESAERDDFEG